MHKLIATVSLMLMASLSMAQQSIDQNQTQASGRNPSATPPTVKLANKQQQQQAQQQEQSQTSTASNGDMVSMNTAQFYALSLTFPNASDCFTGIQGGASDSDVSGGTSGFLGIHWLNRSCWMDKLADEERDIVLNARLKCHDKHYRNAVAYDAPKGMSKRDWCVELKVQSGRKLMAEHKNDLGKLIDQQRREQRRLAECHERIDDANERTERCVEQLTQDK